MNTGKLFKLFFFCLVLVIIRFIKTDQCAFLFLLWNLFLAFIPYVIIKCYNSQQHKLLQFVVVVTTILFLPNAPYILTDLFHLKKSQFAPMWYDLILILSFAFLGMVFFILSINRLLSICNFQFRSRLITSGLKFLIMLSSAYGIYLGRYLRLNSWNVVSHPFYLIKQIVFSVFNENCYKETFSITITFTIFLYLIFEIATSFKTETNTSHNELS